jgi:flagellar hook-length control protein FliK
MGLSITSSAPKVSGISQENLAGPASTEAPPGDFLALLSSELGNFFLAPVADTTDSLENTKPAQKDKPLSLEATGSLTPQVDPALLAALSAAGAMTQKTMPTTTEGISISTNNQAQEPEATTLIGDISTPGLIPFNLKTTATQPSKTTLATNGAETATQTQNITPEQLGQKSSSPEIGKTPTFHQTFSTEFLKTTAELPSTQSLPTEAPPVATTSPNSLHSKPVNHFESDVATHIQEKIWPQQFGEKIIWMAKADVQSAQINLNPPELGPIQITLNLSGDQAKLTFASPHLEVRQSIENALPQLKEMLSSSGISLGQANVGANLQQQPREAQFQSTNGRHSADENAILSGSEATIATGISTSTKQGRGLVDLFA